MLAAALLFLPLSQQPDLDAVVARLQKNMAQAKTISMDVEMNSAGNTAVTTFRVKAMRPNFFKVEGPENSFYSDGQQSFMTMSKENKYAEMGPAKAGMRIPLAAGFEFFSPAPDYKADYLRAENAQFGGKPVIALVSEVKQLQGLVIKVFLDPTSYWPTGSAQIMGKNVQYSAYRNLKTDVPMSAVDFVWSPPAGATKMGGATTESLDLLKAGTQAPEFVVDTLDGKKKSLRELLNGKKALLLNFWFINCGYCMLEMPHLDKLQKRLRSKGVEVIAVNDVDSLADVREFAAKPKYSFTIGVDADKSVAKAYKVAGKGHPITYLIGADGKVELVKIGFSESQALADVEAALKKLGIE